MHSYWVYMLQCSDNSYYTGVTNDVTHRVDEHQHGTNKKAYTYERRPVVLVYSCQFQDIHEAIAWEKQLKGWTRKKKEAVINDEWEKLPGLAKKDFAKYRNKLKNKALPASFDTPHQDSTEY